VDTAEEAGQSSRGVGCKQAKKGGKRGGKGGGGGSTGLSSRWREKEVDRAQ